MSETKKTTDPKFKNLLLTESVYSDGSNEPKKNFVGIPLNDECPFIEVVFDPIKNILGVISKHKKKQFQFVPKLDNNGNPKANSNKAMAKQMPVAQERLLMDTYHEYYIRDEKDIDRFLKMYAINTRFSWTKYKNQ